MLEHIVVSQSAVEGDILAAADVVGRLLAAVGTLAAFEPADVA